MLRKDTASARVLCRARTLLLAAKGYPHKEIAQVLGVSEPTVIKTCRRFLEEGVAGALYDRPRPGAQPKLDTKGEATLIVLACSEPPEGRAHWTMQLLADKLVALGVVESISDETVRRTLRNRLKPWQKKHWCIGKLTAEFFWRMEDILDLYGAPYAPQRPVVCFDERPLQLLAEVYKPWPAAPGKPRREDYKYQRRGTCHLLMCLEPGRGWRSVQVRERRTSQAFARQMKWLVDKGYPEAEVIRVVLDNLNTHTPAAFYKSFPPEEARRLTRKLASHYPLGMVAG